VAHIFRTLRVLLLSMAAEQPRQTGERRVKVKLFVCRKMSVDVKTDGCFLGSKRLRRFFTEFQISIISGIIPSPVTLNKATVGLDMNGLTGFVGLPGFMNRVFVCHLMLDL
jgi:hypothetical protein